MGHCETDGIGRCCVHDHTPATPLDLEAIEARCEKAMEAVNREGQPMGRMMAWATHGAPIIRTDLPALVEEVKELRRLLRWPRLEHGRHCQCQWCGEVRAAFGEPR